MVVVSQGPTTKRTPANWAGGARQALSGPQTLLPGTGRRFAAPVGCCVLTLSSPFYRDPPDKLARVLWFSSKCPGLCCPLLKDKTFSSLSVALLFYLVREVCPKIYIDQSRQGSYVFNFVEECTFHDWTCPLKYSVTLSFRECWHEPGCSSPHP
ncbi:hypothetical protein PAL_GLEAN10016963 [Pteropus alecto]|uniref:Uncharacterized protein n=1 Tax=Pteropus alecto TaxID=9402 RepID=L5JXD3_PTEAL|nr:hypothetical protein PAL_GLEAN10016963 [Pteropus alecto]